MSHLPAIVRSVRRLVKAWNDCDLDASNLIGPSSAIDDSLQSLNALSQMVCAESRTLFSVLPETVDGEEGYFVHLISGAHDAIHDPLIDIATIAVWMEALSLNLYRYDENSQPVEIPYVYRPTAGQARAHLDAGGHIEQQGASGWGKFDGGRFWFAGMHPDADDYALVDKIRLVPLPEIDAEEAYANARIVEGFRILNDIGANLSAGDRELSLALGGDMSRRIERFLQGERSVAEPVVAATDELPPGLFRTGEIIVTPLRADALPEGWQPDPDLTYLNVAAIQGNGGMYQVVRSSAFAMRELHGFSLDEAALINRLAAHLKTGGSLEVKVDGVWCPYRPSLDRLRRDVMKGVGGTTGVKLEDVRIHEETNDPDGLEGMANRIVVPQPDIGVWKPGSGYTGEIKVEATDGPYVSNPTIGQALEHSRAGGIIEFKDRGCPWRQATDEELSELRRAEGWDGMLNLSYGDNVRLVSVIPTDGPYQYEITNPTYAQLAEHLRAGGMVQVQIGGGWLDATPDQVREIQGTFDPATDPTSEEVGDRVRLLPAKVSPAQAASAATNEVIVDLARSHGLSNEAIEEIQHHLAMERMSRDAELAQIALEKQEQRDQLSAERTVRSEERRQLLQPIHWGDLTVEHLQIAFNVVGALRNQIEADPDAHHPKVHRATERVLCQIRRALDVAEGEGPIFDGHVVAFSVMEDSPEQIAHRLAEMGKLGEVEIGIETVSQEEAQERAEIREAYEAVDGDSLLGHPASGDYGEDMVWKVAPDGSWSPIEVTVDDDGKDVTAEVAAFSKAIGWPLLANELNPERSLGQGAQERIIDFVEADHGPDGALTALQRALKALLIDEDPTPALTELQDLAVRKHLAQLTHGHPFLLAPGQPVPHDMEVFVQGDWRDGEWVGEAGCPTPALPTARASSAAPPPSRTPMPPAGSRGRQAQ